MSDRSATFTAIHARKRWGTGESVSGPGSSLEATVHLRRELALLLQRIQARSILDLPCGDFNWMRAVDLSSIEYIGADLVGQLVAENTRLHTTSRRRFLCMDVVSDALPCVDLVICRDCLVHLPNAAVSAALSNIARSGSRYLLTTHFSWFGSDNNREIRLGEWRRVNLCQPPFNLPPPLHSIVEGNTDNFPAHLDKTLSLWDLCQLQKI